MKSNELEFECKQRRVAIEDRRHETNTSSFRRYRKVPSILSRCGGGGGVCVCAP